MLLHLATAYVVACLVIGICLIDTVSSSGCVLVMNVMAHGNQGQFVFPENASI